MGRKVTDPKILAQLNSSGEQHRRKVTDPNILAQLNGSDNESQINNDFNPSFSQKLAPNIVAGLGKLGENLLNAPYNIASFLEKHADGQPTLAKQLGLKASQIPHKEEFDYGNALKIPQTDTDKTIQSLVSDAPSILMPEIKGLGLGAGFLEKLLSRVSPQAGYGFATNKEPLEGAKQFGGTQLAVEGLGVPFRAAAKLAEKYNPLKFTEGKIKAIKDYFDATSAEQKAAYSHMDPYKENIISVTPKKLINEEDVKLFTPKVMEKYEQFLPEPNIVNAHKLQSQMFNTANRVTSSDMNSVAMKEAYERSRSSLQNKIIGSLESLDPEAGIQYARGRDITRELISPLKANKDLRHISSGKVTNMQPKDLRAAIQKGYQEEKIKPTHMLMEISKALNKKIKTGEGLQKVIPPLVGGSLGALGSLTTGFGAAGHGMGTIGGATAGHYLNPKFIELAQDPWFVKMLQKAGIGVQGGARIYNTSGENNE